ncbi:MAG TPA: hypothetical protein VNA57_01775 [Acidimicrobiales bacterium]|nr:hypothetical protein [Acidimicrobiales bacterium]
MATAPEHLTPEQEQREREHAASFHAARSRAGDPEFMASMNERLEVLNRSTRRTTMTREEFLAHTETPDV